MGNTLMEFKHLLFFLEYRFVLTSKNSKKKKKKKLTDGNLIRKSAIKRILMLQFLWLEESRKGMVSG